MSEYVANVAEQYFSSLNPIAARIHADITETKNAYEKLWDQLSPSEQSQIIDESIIAPEISLQYGLVEAPTDKSYAQKIIHEENVAYRDEFSAPFSYKTPSQMDLRVFSDQPILPGSPMLKSQIKPNNSKKKEILIDDICVITNDNDISTHDDLMSTLTSNQNIDDILNETPSEHGQDEITCLLSNDGVKKTGYDFLDNW